MQVIEDEIDRLAAQLWGLTDEELRAIQTSLVELSSDDMRGGYECPNIN